eukprot:157787_1
MCNTQYSVNTPNYHYANKQECEQRSYHYNMEEPTQRIIERKTTRPSVRFSDLSSMLSYDLEATSHQQDLHYTPLDYAQMKRDALEDAQKIRSCVEPSQDSASKASDHKSPLMQYTDSWKRLPHQLQENG